LPFCPPYAGEAPPVALRAASASAPLASSVTVAVPVTTGPPASGVHTAFAGADLGPAGFGSCHFTGGVAAGNAQTDAAHAVTVKVTDRDKGRAAGVAGPLVALTDAEAQAAGGPV
ncbi:hypothetical protein VM98_36035, partial [Streptomyces rubellomurinus subsp. indigoferus]